MDERDPIGHLAGTLRLSIGHIARRMRHVYATSGPADDMSFAQFAILSRLGRAGPMAPTALAKAERITPQAVGTVLSGLASQGLVARRPDPTDGRRLIVTITDGGRAAVGARTEVVTQRIADALRRDFTADELRRFEDVVPLLDRLSERI